MRKTLFNGVAGVLFLLGLGDIPENVKGWMLMLSFISLAELGRWACVIGGISIVLLTNTSLGKRLYLWFWRNTYISEDEWKHFKNWEHVQGRKFVNEEVIIDGKFFDKCEFENASLMFLGTGPVRIEEPLWRGTLAFKSPDQAVLTAGHMFQLVAEVNQALTGKPTQMARVDAYGKYTQIDIKAKKLP